MKIWTKIHISDQKKDIELIAKALTNYLYIYGPITKLIEKYNITPQDLTMLDQYTSNRIAGLLMLYLAKDNKRINDIINKYNITSRVDNIIPEIEGYINKESI